MPRTPRSSRRLLRLPPARRTQAQLRRARELLHLQQLHPLQRPAFGRPRLPRRFSRRQFTWAAGPIIILLLLIFVARRYVAQKIDIEATLRRQIIPQLEKEIGRKIEVGQIESDWFSQITLHDIVVGRDAALPTGALLRAKRAVIHLNLVNLALRRTEPLAALGSVQLDSPQVYVVRQRNGRINLLDLWKPKTPPQAKQRWNGTISIANGRIFYRDELLRDPRGRPLLADIRQIAASGRFNGEKPVQLELASSLALIGAEKTPVRRLRLNGDIDPDGRWLGLDVYAPRLPAPLLTAYAFPKGDLVARAGVIGGHLRLAYDEALPKSERVLAGGAFQLHNVAGWAKALLEPGTKTPLPLRDVNGPLRLSGSTLETSGLTFSTLDTAARMKGTVALSKPPVFDLHLYSDSAATNRLLQVARNAAPPDSPLRQWQFAGERAQVAVDISGTAQAPLIGATIVTAAFTARHAQFGAWRGEAARAAVNYFAEKGTPRVQATVSTRALHGAQPSLGEFAGGALQAEIAFAGAPGAQRAQVRFHGQSPAARSARYGRASAPEIGGVLRWNAGDNTSGGAGNPAKFALRFNAPSLGVAVPRQGEWQIGDANGALLLTGSGPRAQLTARLNGARAGGEHPQLGRWQLETARASLEYSAASGRGAAQLKAAAVEGRHPAQGALRAANVRLRGGWTNAKNAESPLLGAARWETGAVAATHPEFGFLQAAALRGVARLDDGAALEATLQNFRAANSTYGSLRGETLRAVATTPNLQQPRWSGRAFGTNINASGLNLAALSPQAAARVSGLGTLSGTANFQNLGGADPVVSADLRLTRVTVADEQFGHVALRDVTTHAAFAGGRLRLTDARAQSEFGPLEANLEVGGGAPLNFSLTAARAVIPAARLNPFLATQNIRLSGTAVGRLAVRSADDNRYRAEFDLSLARASVTHRTAGVPSTLRTGETHLRGEGAVALRGDGDWRFEGDAILFAKTAEVRVANGGSTALPAWLNGSRTENLRVTATGDVTRANGVIEPQLAGEATFSSISTPLPQTTNDSTLTLHEIGARWAARPGAIELPRLSLRWAEGEVTGHATVQTGDELQITGQLLAEKLDATQLQSFATAYTGETAWTVRGQGFVQADFSGTPQDLTARIQARLYDGAVRAAPDQETVPIDAARATFALQLPFHGRVPIEDITLWSRGGRFHLDGALEKQGDDIALDLHALVTTLRARDALLLPAVGAAVESLRRSEAINGLISGDVQITGTARHPQVEGRAAVRLAQAFGLNVGEATANLLFESSEAGARFALRDLAGRAEDAPFTGNLDVDFARNQWTAQLQTEEIPAGRLLAAADRVRPGERPANRQLRALPLRGALRADIQLSGTLRAPDGSTRFAPQDGFAKVHTDALRWRGLPLGVLDADLALDDELVTVRALELRDPATQAIRFQLAGALPLSGEGADDDLRLTATLNDEPLSFFVAALQEARTTLTARGRSTAALEPIFATLEKLPPGFEGQIAANATLTNSFAAPVVKVENLTIHDAKLRAPSGILQELPTLHASFVYDQGAITIQQAELRLRREDREGEDAVLHVLEGSRIVPGGEIAVQADLLNANLSQLAPWVRALRGRTGQPVLSGALAQFTVLISGTTDNPQVIGSILAENLEYQEYSLDRLRISRFDIANGALEIRPGNLTIVKGDFQSQVAWGRVPWSWKAPGPVMDAPIEVHLPLATRDFGALAGVFVPAITNVDASEFQGSIDVTGTLQQPLLSGEAAIEGGRFRFDPAGAPFEAGMQEISGRVLFINGNQVQIDPERPLRAKLVPAGEVQAPTTGNPPAAERDPRTRARASGTNIGGELEARGGVTFDLDPRHLARPARALASSHYDLQLRLRDGEYSTDSFSGAHNIEMAAIWRTGSGEARLSQNVRWLLRAEGGGKAKKRRGGRLLAMAALRLNPNSAADFDALTRPAMEEFDDFAAFEDAPIFAGLPLDEFRALPTRHSQIVLQDLVFSMQNVAEGELNGTITMDNEPVRTDFAPQQFGPPRPTLAARLLKSRETSDRTPLVASSLQQAKLRSAKLQGAKLQSARLQSEELSNATIRSAARSAQAPTPPEVREQLRDFAELPPVRLAGRLVLSDATLRGAPAGSAGGTLLDLPDAPAFDLQLELGEDVRFDTAVLRADIGGEAAIVGTPRNPLLTGTFFTRTGQISFPKARARITEGEISITAARDPLLNTLVTRIDLNVTARGHVDRYDITLELKGPLELEPGEDDAQQLQINVTSNPPLSRGEAFEKLLGTAALNTQGGDDSLLTGAASDRYKSAIVGLLSAPLFSSIERSLEDALGLSSVAFEYRFNEPLGVEVGKAIGDRVYITYRRTIGSNGGGPTPYELRIEYRIRGNLNIGLQTDERERRQITVEKTWRF